MKALLYRPIPRGHHVRVFLNSLVAAKALAEDLSYWGPDVRMVPAVADNLLRDKDTLLALGQGGTRVHPALEETF